jgi:L,D-peptidoglycan transpeptidase YkuD (ErfK/YbiS/YcfS/YnhG family)
MNGVEGSQNVIVVTASGYHTHQAILCTYLKYASQLHPVFSPIPAVIGIHGFAPPGGKREGDGRTPSGVYPLEFAFGYAPSMKTKMPYRQATPNDFWVDDARSPQYNQWVHGKPDATSYEVMQRNDNLYEYGVVIGYNKDRVPGMGSAIFLHVWPSPNGHTAGCVAVSVLDMIRILRWLDPAKSPQITMGTQSHLNSIMEQLNL